MRTDWICMENVVKFFKFQDVKKKRRKVSIGAWKSYKRGGGGGDSTLKAFIYFNLIR